MKKLLLIALLLFSCASYAQFKDTTFSVKKTYYFEDLRYPKYKENTVNIDLILTTVNEKTYIVIKNYKSGYIDSYYLKKQNLDIVKPDPEFEGSSYFCENPAYPNAVLMFSFIFYKRTHVLQSIGLTDRIGLLVYEIYYKLPDL